jgi:hypothetical protein
MRAADPAPPAPVPSFEGRLDVVGDVHGEFDALARLLRAAPQDGNGWFFATDHDGACTELA